MKTELELADLREDYRKACGILSTQGFCVYGQYPWDAWERLARERDVPGELATLGRAVMREAHQHQWEPLQCQLAGWDDEGETMIELALQGPDRARFIWQTLLDTDGCRGSYHRETGQWVSWL